MYLPSKCCSWALRHGVYFVRIYLIKINFSVVFINLIKPLRQFLNFDYTGKSYFLVIFNTQNKVCYNNK